MGVMKHERQTKCLFWKKFSRPAFLLPGENRRRTSAYQRDRRNVSILKDYGQGRETLYVNVYGYGWSGKRPGQEALMERKRINKVQK